MNWSEYDDIWIDADRMSGVPCLKGTRVTPETILDNVEGEMEDGLTEQEAILLVHSNFPTVSIQQIEKLLAYVTSHPVKHAA